MHGWCLGLNLSTPTSNFFQKFENEKGAAICNQCIAVVQSEISGTPWMTLTST
jgi:hypothetical protein